MSESSVIGAGTVVGGHVHGEGSLEIFGRVEGDVSVTGNVVVGPAGRIRGNVSGAQLTIFGQVQGDLRGTEAVLLERGARVEGDIEAPRVGIAPGALARGHVTTGSEPAGTQARGVPAVRMAEPPPRVAPPAPRVEPAVPAPLAAAGVLPVHATLKPPAAAGQAGKPEGAAVRPPQAPAAVRPPQAPAAVRPPLQAPAAARPPLQAPAAARPPLQAPAAARPPIPAPAAVKPAPQASAASTAQTKPDLRKSDAPPRSVPPQAEMEFTPVRPLKPEPRRPPPPVVPVISKGTRAKKKRSHD